MAEPNNERSSLNGQMRGIRKRAGRSSDLTPPGLGSGSGSGCNGGVPCGACKFLRRKCVNGCIFAPHFGPEQGAALFAAVHKIFGASNVSKLLVQLPVHHRRYAVETLLYEAQARLTDPVSGCVKLIIDLYQQVTSLQMKLAMAQNRLITNRLMTANTAQGSLQQPELLNNNELFSGHHLDLQPVYSNGSSVSNNNINMFDSNQHDHQYAAYSQPISDPLLFTGPYVKNEDDDVEETGDPLVFADQMF